MKKSLFILFVALSGYVLPGCSQPKTNVDGAVAQDISVAEFKKMSHDNPGTILDVRTADEVSRGAIPGYINIDFYNSDFIEQVSKLDKEKPVYVYCAVGGRSGQAKEMLSNAGFKQVYNLEGGYKAYSSQK